MYQSLFEIVTFFNRPTQDGKLLSQAGVQLDKTLFPLLMTLQHKGSLGIVELAGNVNKDYSTVSRQVDVLEELGLVSSAQAEHDKRMRYISMTQSGDAMVERIAETRRVMMAEHLREWSDRERRDLWRVLKKLADSLDH